MVDAKVFDPVLVLFQHDLLWWAEYARGNLVADFLDRVERQKTDAFADDFTPSHGKPSAKFILVQAEINGFLCQLTTLSGPVVALGIGLVTCNGDSVSIKPLVRMHSKI